MQALGYTVMAEPHCYRLNRTPERDAAAVSEQDCGACIGPDGGRIGAADITL